jgi:pimeloyl-ACP methyl ester carboxylesterase
MISRPGRKKRRLILAALLAAGMVGALAAAASAETWLAYAVVSAPNLGSTIDPADDPAPAQLTALGVDRHLRVEVGPPSASLSAWIIEPEIPDAEPSPQSPADIATVLVLHGIRDGKASMLSMGIKLSQSGFRAAVVDLRGHGRSSGDYLTYGVVEARDLSQLIDALVAQGLAADRLGVLAPSYGGAAAIQLSVIDPRVRAVVAAATFTSLEEIVPVYVRRFAPAWLVPDSVIKLGLKKAGRIASFDPARADNRRAIAATRSKVLLIHSRTDEKIPYHHSQILHRAAGERASLTLLPDGDHNSILGHPGAKAAGIEWLQRWLR